MPAARLLARACFAALVVSLSSLPVVARADVLDMLLAVDQHRPQVIEHIVDAWGPRLAQSPAPVSIDELRGRLQGLRADRLLAASMADSLDALREVIASAPRPKPSLLQTKALGDATIDGVYTPVTPCRLVETRGTFAAVYQGDGSANHLPLPFTPNQIRTYTVQGGNNVCLTQLPSGLHPTAVQLQVFGMPTTSTSGDIEILPQAATFGKTATMVYVASIAFNTVSTAARINPANNQISVQVRGGGANVAIDVVGYFKSAADATAMNIQVNGQRVMRYEYNATSPNVAGGFPGNVANAANHGQTIAGGGSAGDVCDEQSVSGTASCLNRTSYDFSTVGGGRANQAVGDYTTVGGGYGNTATNIASVVAGGLENAAVGLESSVSGGSGNLASGDWSHVAGGNANQALGTLSGVLAGDVNKALGVDSVVLGGVENTAAGDFSFAAGTKAVATGKGSFVWTDSQPFAFDNASDIYGWGSAIAAANTFTVRATGGVWFATGVDGSGRPVAGAGVEVLAGQGAWATYSDRNGKDIIGPVDARSVLDRLATIPVSIWRWKGERSENRHMGPMAQDFYAAFGLGADDRHIVTVDADGVALAAIQGLRDMLREKDAEIVAQRLRLDALEATVDELKRAIAGGRSK